MKEKRLYTEGYKLQPNEFLLKLRERSGQKIPTGFLTKFNNNGSMPVSFEDWGVNHYYNNRRPDDHLPIYIFEETYRSGWKIESWRFGQSQNWATMIHPEGFTVEIYLQQLLEIIQSNTIVNGKLDGKYRWEDKKLIKK
jgi:hypothetical protein